MMGTWEPVSATMQWWIPLGISTVLASLYVVAAWKHRKFYPIHLLWFHFLYIVWFATRGIGAVLIHEYISNGDLILRTSLLAIAVVVVAISYQTARSGTFREELGKHYMAGPDEVLWSPDPIVGYRITIHAMGSEIYTGARAECRYGDRYHDPTEAPTWGCRCGYYAWKVGDLTKDTPFGVIVFMWGRVIEAEHGYRSEYMRPIGYWRQKPLVAKEEEIDISTFGSPMRKAIASSLDPNRCFGFLGLPVVRTEEQLAALIEKARNSFDPEAPPDYDGGYNGYRTANTQN